MYLIFGTETTGNPKSWRVPVTDVNNWPRLVQLAYLLYDNNGNKVSEGDFIIRPNGFIIPTGFTKIHGISTAKANRDGIELSTVLLNFQSLVDQAECLVSHNMILDEKVMGAELLRNRMLNSIEGKKKICTMQKTVDFCAIEGHYGYKWPKLSELHYKLFKTGYKKTYNASVDINATARCFWELKRLGEI